SGLGLSLGSSGSAVCGASLAPFSATGSESIPPQPDNSNVTTHDSENIHRMGSRSFSQLGAFRSIRGAEHAGFANIAAHAHARPRSEPLLPAEVAQPQQWPRPAGRSVCH